jgi:hypothetical protein
VERQEMKCPNPSCEREMRMITFDYADSNFKSRYCSHCGRGHVKEVGEVAWWKCDNCGAEVWSAEENNLRIIAKGAVPKLASTTEAK